MITKCVGDRRLEDKLEVHMPGSTDGLSSRPSSGAAARTVGKEHAMMQHRYAEEVVTDAQRRHLRRKYCAACSTKNGDYCLHRCLLGEKKPYNTIALASIARISAPQRVAISA